MSPTSPGYIKAAMTVIMLTLMVSGVHGPALAGDSALVNIRAGVSGDLTRFVIDLDGPADFRTFTLDDPARIVVDLAQVSRGMFERERGIDTGLIVRARFGTPTVDVTRVVLDLVEPGVVQDTLVLGPEGDYGHRIVLDIAPLVSAATLSPENAVEDDGFLRPGVKPPPPLPIIVLDPGHGGPDPGAVGASGAHEKDIVLAAARELKAMLDETGRYHVVMTREGDSILRLADRVLFARAAGADLFISIHADSIDNPDVRGMGVYTLSETASDKEAEALARNENRSDLIEGVDFVSIDYDPVTTNILIDLAQRETKNASSEFAGILAGELTRVTELRRNVHRFAGFRVLKAPDVPSILIEMGFMSNPVEERLMMDRSWRRTFLAGVARAIDTFMASRR
ncbi:MAG: N-acetylmuramoyl-L-alanine amidase [bacterium]|nr:N-acetylmuramoyl-L-alanine amidase [bacterium]